MIGQTQTPRAFGRTTRWLIGALALVGSLAVLALHAAHYMPFLADDALISLRYADRFIDGLGLTWTEGARVEGYSNLLWILLASALGRIGLDLVDAVRLLGVLCTAVTAGAIVYRHPPRGPADLVPLAVGLLTYVLAGPTAIWAIGGMEQPLVAALLAWALVLTQRSLADGAPDRLLLPISALLALLCLARPDGPLFSVAVFLAVFLVKGWKPASWRRALKVISLPVLAFAGQMLFRLLYYGDWVPNTARVKVSPSLTHLGGGVHYLWDGFLALTPLSGLAALVVLAGLLSRRRFAEIASFVTTGLLWAAYLVGIGGDIFPGWRHFVPLIVVMALVNAQGAKWAIAHPALRRGRPLQAAVLAGALVWFFHVQGQDPTNRRAVTERWEWDGKVVGQMLKRGFGPAGPLLAVTAAGCLPYWSELPSLDMMGLNDATLARHRPRGFGEGYIGHELGDGRYVLGRKPDLVVFCGPRGAAGACFLSGRQMVRLPAFQQAYALTQFEGEGARRVRSRIWVRRESERIGIRRSGDRIVVPAYLLNGNARTVARLNPDGRFAIAVAPSAPAYLVGLTVPPGTWAVEAHTSDGSRIAIGARWAEGRDVEFRPDAGVLVVKTAGDARVDFALSPASPQGEAQVTGLVLRRTQPRTRGWPDGRPTPP